MSVRSEDGQILQLTSVSESLRRLVSRESLPILIGVLLRDDCGRVSLSWRDPDYALDPLVVVVAEP